MLKNILRNLNVLNAVLIVLLILFVHYGLMPRLETGIQLKPKTAAGKSSAVADTAGNNAGTKTVAGPEAEEETKLVPQEYKIISDENLFHPDRTIVKFVPPTKPEEKLPPPDFVLYGTMLTDSVKLAFIDDKRAPYNTPGSQQKRSRTLKVGDTLSGFTVKEIDHEKVIMARNSEEIILKKSASSDKPAPGQPQQRSSPTFPRSPRGGGNYYQPPQNIAPAAPLAPPTIITVPAIPVQPATPSQQPATGTPKTHTQPVGTPSSAPKTQQPQQQKAPNQQKMFQ